MAGIEPLCHLRRLVELDLRGNSLLGALPERLGMLGELQVLRIPAAAALGALKPGHHACAASTAESGGARLPLLVALHRRHTRRTVAVQLRVAQGGRIRAWLWSPSAAPPMLHPPPASGVHLIVYDLAEFNKWSMNVGVGVFHTAIYLELLDIELNFAALPPCGSTPAAMRRLTPRSGVFVTPRGGAARWMPVRHRQSIALGQVRPHGQARQRQRQGWPPTARGALALAHGGPPGSRAELRSLGSRSACVGPLRGATKVADFTPF